MPTTPTGVNLVFERSDELGAAGHEQVVFCRDEATGLRAIIAIHSTRLGPALGGTRFHPYAGEADALTDVLRLSQGMTAKAAAAGLALGGGKAVIIGDPTTTKTPDLLRAYGRFVDSLGGRYVTAADVGTTAADLDVIAGVTRHVVGSNQGSGDSGRSTALGVFHALQAAARFEYGEAGLAGRRVGVEGVGKVGHHLVSLLVEAGAAVVVTDPFAPAVERVLEAHPQVDVADDVLGADVDVYAPCALGATLTPESVQRLRAQVVCGAANNQLLDSSVGDLLAQRGITWVPDYVANAGGLVQVGGERLGHGEAQVREGIAAIGDTVAALLQEARATGRSTAAVAADLVRRRLENKELVR